MIKRIVFVLLLPLVVLVPASAGAQQFKASVTGTVVDTQGAVIPEAVITREGTIDPSRLRVLQTASPLLTPAALEAVKQWRYRPTTLNGQAVEVLTTITINFTLN